MQASLHGGPVFSVLPTLWKGARACPLASNDGVCSAGIANLRNRRRWRCPEQHAGQSISSLRERNRLSVNLVCATSGGDELDPSSSNSSSAFSRLSLLRGGLEAGGASTVAPQQGSPQFPHSPLNFTTDYSTSGSSRGAGSPSTSPNNSSSCIKSSSPHNEASLGQRGSSEPSSSPSVDSHAAQPHAAPVHLDSSPHLSPSPPPLPLQPSLPSQLGSSSHSPILTPPSASSFPSSSISSSSSPESSPGHPSSSSPPSASSGLPGTQAQGNSPEVDAAVARAQAVLSQLESSLDTIPQLPSAAISSHELPMPPMRHKGPWGHALAVARNVTIVAAAAVALLASHAFGLAVQLLSAVAGAVAIAYWGHRRGSLSASGAVVAFMVGVGTLCCSLRFGATLLAFFFASSKLTHFKEEVKAQLDDNARKGGQRDWKQVLCNGLVPTGVAVAYGLVAGCVDVPLGPSQQLELWRAKVLTLLGGAYLGWYACCCGDTWASEVGPLSSAMPRLITSLRPVRRGTNGGVTVLGLAASLAGGTFVGLVFYLAGLVSPTLWIFEAQRATAAGQWLLIPLGMLAGLVGSLVDSLLGATVQFSGYNHETGRVTSTPGPSVTRITGMPVLDNNMVNVVSAALTAAMTACAAFWVFGA